MIIRIENRQIDFDGDFSFQLNNPMLTDSVSHSLQSTFEDTPEIREILGFINLPYIAENKTKELNATISLLGITYVGTIKVTYQNKKFSWYFKTTSDFWESVKILKLTDVNFPIITNTALDQRTFIQDCNQDAGSINKKCVFPVIYNPTFSKNWKYFFQYSDFINLDSGSVNGDIKDLYVPLFYVQYVVREIFNSMGITIRENILEEDPNLKRLIIYNNYAINSFAVSDEAFIFPDEINEVVSISNEKECVVTMSLPLKFADHSFIKFTDTANVPEFANKKFQIEKKDETSFKLIQEDSTNYTKLSRTVFKSKAIEKYNTQTIFHLNDDLPDAFTTGLFHIVLSRDADSEVTVTCSRMPLTSIYPRVNYKVLTGSVTYDGETFYEGDEFEGVEGVTAVSGTGTIVATRTVVADFNCTAYNVGKVLATIRPGKTHRVEKEPITYNGEIRNPGDEFKYVQGVNGYTGSGILVDASSDEYVLAEQVDAEHPNMRVRYCPLELVGYNLDYNLKIDPKNHMPVMKLSDFFNSFKYLGVYVLPSEYASEARILSKKDIILKQDSIDISEYASEITDIENPGKDGYLLKSPIPSEDSYFSSLVKMQEIDTKYIIKDPVTNFVNLPAEEDQNTVRLVTSENKYYLFLKGFLNTENIWSFFTFDHLDNKSGAGDLLLETAFSTLLKEKINNQYFPSTRDNGLVSQVQYIAENQFSPRLLVFRGVLADIPYASHDIYFADNSAMPNENLSLTWKGETGIINTYLKEILDWELNVRKDCKTTIQWPVHYLMNFDFAKKYRIRGINYLVKSIKYNYRSSKKRIEHNETELAKV